MSDDLPFLPLSVPNVSGHEQEYVTECLASGWLSAAGSFVGRFEAAVAEFVGARHAVACASGTAALHVALVSLGIGHGDAVIVPSATFIASANAVHYTGALPVLIDCDERLGIDCALLGEYLERAWSETDSCVIDPASGRRVRAVMPVHIFGDPVDMDALMPLAEKYGLVVLEDATESLGTRFTSGKYAGRATGTIGHVAAFSFNGNKIISTGGGGMLVTDDDELAARARYLFHQAKDDTVRYVHGAVGFNYALSNVAAAIGVAQMEQLPGFITTKQANRARYASGLEGVAGLTFLSAPEGTDPNCWFYSVLVDAAEFGMDREGLMAELAAVGIQTRPLWLPVHMQTPYAGCPSIGGERAQWYWERLLNLPCSTDLRAEDVDRVVSVIRSLARS